VSVGKFDPADRASEKAQQRAQDDARLMSGEVSRQALRHEVSFVPVEMIRGSRLLGRPNWARKAA